VKIHFGAMAPKLEEQVPGTPPCIQDDADAVTRLFLRGLMTEVEARNVRKRIVKAIEKQAKTNRGS
jgi:hypothetical protein